MSALCISHPWCCRVRSIQRKGPVLHQPSVSSSWAGKTGGPMRHIPPTECWSSWRWLLLQMSDEVWPRYSMLVQRHGASGVCRISLWSVGEESEASEVTEGQLQFTSRTSSYVVVLSQQQKKEHGEVSRPLNFPEFGASVHSAMNACRSVMWMGSWVWCLMVS